MLALSENKLLSPESTDMIINSFRSLPERRPTFNFRGGSYGINAVISYDADKEMAVIVLSNYDPPSASNLANRLIESIRVGAFDI